MTVNSFLNRKIDVCFQHGDQNGDGVLEKEDTLLAAFENFWTRVSLVMDTNRDGKVTPLEWREGMLNAFANNPEQFAEGLRPLAAALFAVCDRDDDGKVSPQEFACFQKAFGTSAGNTRIAFERLDRDGDGYLEVGELLDAWTEYYTSADPEARGNWLYGNIFDEDVWNSRVPG